MINIGKIAADIAKPLPVLFSPALQRRVGWPFFHFLLSCMKTMC
jgi:hypothetical protein